MSLLTFLFGDKPEKLEHAPGNARWRDATPRRDPERVRAWLAQDDAAIDTGHGVLRARAGQDMIVEYEDGGKAVVRRNWFERMYQPAGEGLFQKRPDLKLRYFTLDRSVIVHTAEGTQIAAPGDWIFEGLHGELWPVPRNEARQKYVSG